jgi:CBS domain-containing protein
MLTVRDLMVPEPITVEAQDSLRVAADLLTSAAISGAPVMAAGRVVGMVSLTDLVRFEADDPGVPVFRPDVVDDPFEGTDPFEEIDPNEADGRGDPTAWFARLWEDSESEVGDRIEHPDTPEWNPLDQHTVAEVMSRVVHQVAPLTPVTEAARLMEKEQIHRLLVVDDGAPVGILTTSDIVRAVARGELAPAGAGPSLVL